MTWKVDADVADPKAAIEHFRSLVPMTADEYEFLDSEAQKQAFVVSGVVQLDLVSEIYNAIDDAIANGATLEDFKKAVSASVKDAWSAGSELDAHRLETIFRTNVQSAYMAGRYAEHTDPEALEDRPYWQYDATDESCDVCEPCDGVVLPAEDPWWNSHHPILHPNCACDVDAISHDDAKERGIDKAGPDVEAADGYGDPRAKPDLEPEKADYPEPLWSEFEEKKTGTDA